MKTRLIVLVLIATLVLAACGGGNEEPEAAEAPAATEAKAEPTEAPAPAGDAAKGKATYDTLCLACHGPEGVGVEGLGKPFTTSEFLVEISDEEFAEFIKTGRDISDPANTTGIAMPPKGGNPALTDEQIIDIVAYVRTLHE